MKPSKIISFISTYLPVTLGALSLFQYKHFKNAEKLIFYFLLSTLVFELLARTILIEKSNFPIFHIYTAFEMVIIGSIFLVYLTNINRKMAYILLLIFIDLIYFAYLSFTNQWLIFVPFARVSISIVLIILTIFCLIEIYLKDTLQDTPIYYLSKFYFTLGCIIFYLGTFGLFCYFDPLEHTGNRTNFWVINNVLNIVKYLLYFLALYSTKWKNSYS